MMKFFSPAYIVLIKLFFFFLLIGTKLAKVPANYDKNL